MRIAVVAALICAAIGAYPDTSSREQRILIADFGSNLLSAAEVESVVSNLSDLLSKQPGVSVVDAATRAAAVKELELSLSGIGAESGRLKLGALLSASRIVTGSIGKLGSREFILNAQMLDSQTGEIVKSTSRSYLSLALLLSDARNVVASLLLPTKAVPADYIVMTPESQRIFFFVPAGYSALRNEDEGLLSVDGFATGFWVSAGRPWGFVAGGGVSLPLAVSNRGLEIAPSDLQLPMVMEASLGAGYLKDLGRRALLQAVAGAYFAEFLSVTKSGSYLNGNSVFLDVGPFAEASLWYRLRLSGYLRAGIKAAYFPHLFWKWAGGTGTSGYMVEPSICLGFGRN
jgi:hypothetical protein